MAEEAGHSTEGGEGGAGTIRKLCNNKRRSLGPEWSMYDVGNPPPHYLDKPQGLAESINSNHNTVQTCREPQEGYDTYLWGGLWRRGSVNVYSVITMRYEIGGMLGGGVPDKGV